MGAQFHLTYKNPTGGGVPSPVDGPDIKEWPYNKWAKLIPYISRMGVTVLILPPVTKGGSLGAGWDPFDLLDFGSKNQRGRFETRYGSLRDLRRLIAIAHAHGMQIYSTVVHHHADGGDGKLTYKTLGSDGKTLNGEIQWDWNCFWTEGNQNPDTVPDPQWDMSFGNEFRWLTGTFGEGKGSNGPGYVKHLLARALDIQTQTIGIDGYFVDDLKGTSLAYVAWLLNQLSMAGKFAFGEYYDGSVTTLYNYVHNSFNNSRCGVLDFSQRFTLRDICNNPGNADMRRLMTGGLFTRDPFTSVTFVEDIDTDESGPVVTNQLFGYAVICTMPGYPMIFGKSCYENEANCYGLMTPVMQLVWIHEKCANGDIVYRNTSYNHLVFERISNPGMLVGLNNKPGQYSNPSDWVEVTVHCQYWPGTRLHDVTGHANDVTVNHDMTVTLWLPPNEAGKGYVCYTLANVSGAVNLTPRKVSHMLYGEEGLDLGPAKTGNTFVAEIWAGEDPIEFHIYKGTGLSFTVTRPVSGTYGYTSIWVSSAAVMPYVVEVTYTAAGMEGFDAASTPASTSLVNTINVTYQSLAPVTSTPITPTVHERKRSAERKVVEQAHSIYLRRMNDGIPGNADSDWKQAESMVQDEMQAV